MRLFVGLGRPSENELDKECVLERGQNGLGTSGNPLGHCVRVPDMVTVISFPKPALHASDSTQPNHAHIFLINYNFF